MKWPVLLIGNCILIFLIQLINDALAVTTLYFCPSALFIFAPLILLTFTSGLISIIITGLILDASSALPSGTITIILAIVYTGCFWFRHQFKAYSGRHNMVMLQCSNAVIWAFLSVFIISDNYSSLHYWGSILCNLLFSQIAILFISSWFLNLQNSLLNTFSSDLKKIAIQNSTDNSAVQSS